MTYGALFAYGPFGSPVALIVLGIIAILLFGNRLPSVMRSLGRSVVEFKKGVAGLEDEIDDAVRSVDKEVKAKKEESEA
jgi:sec-independent protein translocase protein TatA